MRAAGNLAGVEFIAPPKGMHYETAEAWKTIISESGYFFTKDAMRFFSCRVAWDTLTKITQEQYGFITSEQNALLYEATHPRRYTVRTWTLEAGTESLSQYQEFATLKDAKKYLLNAGWEK